MQALELEAAKLQAHANLTQKLLLEDVGYAIHGGAQQDDGITQKGVGTATAVGGLCDDQHSKAKHTDDDSRPVYHAIAGLEDPP